MIKNYILALLATGTLPLSAFAAIDIPGVAENTESWDLSGVSHVTDEEGLITVPGAQGGYPACTIDALPAGEYILTGTLKNAQFVVLLNNEEVALKADGSFKTTVAGDLVIEVKAIDKAAEYKFGNVKLVLNVDLEKIYKDLAGLMPTDDLTAPSQWMKAYNNAEDNIKGTDVVAEYEKLTDTKAIAKLNAAIEEVNPEGLTPEEQLEAYVNYSKSTVEADVKAYAKAVTEYEEGIAKTNDKGEVVKDKEGNIVYVKYPIETINGWADTYHANSVAHDADLDKINSKNISAPGYAKQLSDLEAQIAANPEHPAKLEKEIDAVKAAIAAATDKIGKNWDAKGVQIGKADYVPVSFDAIEAALKTLKNEWANLLNDEEIYNNLWVPEYEKLTNAYINAQQVIKELYKEEPGQKARQDSVMVAVTAIYNECVNDLAVTYGDGRCTQEEYDDDETMIEAAIKALDARVKEDAANLSNEKAALTAGLKLVHNLDVALTKAAINDDAYDRPNLVAKKKALQEKADALRNQLNEIYASTEVLSDTYVNGDFQEEVDELQAKIDTLAAQIKVANQLGGLTTALNAAKKAIADDENSKALLELDDEYSVNIVDKMQGSYNSLKEAIEQQEGYYDEDYTSVKTSDLDNILNSIGVVPEDPTAEVTGDSYLANGLQMAADFYNAYQIALPDLAAAIDFVNFIANTNPAFDVKVTSTIQGYGVDLSNGVDQAGYKTTANGYKTTAQQIVNDLKAARLASSPQNVFDAIEAVMEAIENANLAENIPTTKINFLEAVIGSTDGKFSNLEELQKAITTLQNELTGTEEYAGYANAEKAYKAAKAAIDGTQEAYDFVAALSVSSEAEPALLADTPATPSTPAAGTTDEEEEVKEVPRTALNPAQLPTSKDAKIASLIKVNEMAKALVETLQGVQNEIDKVVLNYNAYQNVLTLIDKIENVLAPDAVDYAEGHAYQPAQDTWKAQVAEKVKEATDLRSGDLKQIYNRIEMLVATVGETGLTTNEKNFLNKLNKIVAWFDAFKNAVDVNELAHNALLDESAQVTKLVDGVTKTVEAAEVPIILESGEDAADVLKGYVDELSKLDTDLYNTYKNVSCDGQELEGSEEDQTLMYQYEQLRAQVNDLRAQLDDDYAKALKAYNEKFIAENWDAWKAEMMATYTKAIENLDDYQEAVNSCEALAENNLIAAAIDHRPLYVFAPEIQDLIAEVNTLLDTSWPSMIDGEANPDQKKLTDENFAEYIEKAEAIIDGISEVYGEKENTIIDTTDQILTETQEAVENLVKDVTAELEAAGCDKESIDAAVKPANDALKAAAAAINTDLDGRYGPAAVQDEANAINILKGVQITDAQKVAAAQSTFDNAVAAVDKAIAKAQATLDKSNLPTAIAEALQEQLDDATDELNEYRNDKITLANLKEELAKVNGIDVASIQAAIDQAIKDNNKNIENKDALDKLVAGLNTDYNKLNGWVKQLLVAADVAVSAVKDAIVDLQDAIETAYNKGELNSGTKITELKAKMADIEALINATYADAYQKEADRLNVEEVAEANRAYNEAAKAHAEETGVANFPDTEVGKEYRTKIDNLTLQAGAAAAAVKPGEVPTELQQQEIVKIQTALLQVQLDLNYISADIVIAGLDVEAEKTIKAINTSKAALGNYAKEKYAADYDALVAQVEKLQEEWTNSPATVIVQEGVYQKALNDIVKKDLAKLDAAAAAYQADREANAAAEAASNNAYQTLNSALNDVRTSYTTTANYAVTYATRVSDGVATSLETISTDITTDQKQLDAAYATYPTNKTWFKGYKWTNALEDINDNITAVNKTLWYDVTSSFMGEAQQAISDANKALNDAPNVNGAESFASALKTLQSKLGKLAIVKNGKHSDGKACVAACEDIISKAKALFNDILDNEYVPGDITGTGEVTAADYEALIDLLGQIDSAEDFDNPAYDVNGDGKVTGADIAEIIDILMGRTTDKAVMARMPMINTNNAIYVVKTSVNNGVTRYALMLNNTADLFYAQMDIVLGNGMEIVNEGVAERTSSSEFYGSTTYSGKHRVILSSIDMNTFVGSEGAIVYIDVRGEGELSLENVLGTDVNGRMYEINVMTNVTGIESISLDGNNADIFNVAGQKLNRAQRGAVNIIRTADGKASKVINK